MGLAALLTAAPASLAQTVLSNQHADIGVAYEDGQWNLHIHNETDDIEYAPPSGVAGAILQIGLSAASAVPSNPAFGFLGPAQSPVWILPNTQHPNLLFLGFGAEEVEEGIFVGDSLAMSLSSVNGPGHFAVFDYDSFGNPVVRMNTRDGITASDSASLPAGAHNDLNWAFSLPGTYTVSFEASGTLVAGNIFTASGPVAYTFEVVPEPSASVLAGIGLLTLWYLARRSSRRD